MNMDYRCSRCGRTFFYGEIVSFCPFCGQAYNVFSAGDSTLSVVQNAGNMRISIGSDSEKTIQEKYWKLTLVSLNSAMYLLRYGLPRFSPEREARDDQYVKTPEEYETARLDIYKFMALKNSTSFAMFRKNLEGYLSDMKGV